MKRASTDMLLILGIGVLVGILAMIVVCEVTGHRDPLPQITQPTPTYKDASTIIFYGQSPPITYQGEIVQISDGSVLFIDASTKKVRIVSTPFEVIHYQGIVNELPPMPKVYTPTNVL